jgi:hypothetical protein
MFGSGHKFRAGYLGRPETTPPWKQPALASPLVRPDRGACVHTTTGTGYNPPKLIDQAQDPKAKVRTDFGVR